MINKQKMKEILNPYWIIGFIVYAVALFIVKKLLLGIVGVDETTITYKFSNALYSVLFIVLWFITIFVVLRSKLYYYQTGRNFNDDCSKYRRGYRELVEYFKYAEPHKLDSSQFEYQQWYRTKGLVFGTTESRLVTIPSNSECNIAVFGPPGSGKTSGIAITNAIAFEGAVLAVDIKGDIYNYVSNNSNRKIIRFCPDHPDALWESYHFDPFAGIEQMSITDKKLYLESMATILIPEETGTDGYYFSSRARKMFQGITHLLLYYNPKISFPEVVEKILNGNVFDWVKMALESECMEAREQIASFYGNNEKNISAVYDTLTTAIIHFSNPVLNELLRKSDNCISIDLLEKGYDIYLQVSQEHLESYAPLFTLILQTFSSAFTRRPDSSTGVKNKPILMLIDEFPQLTFSYEMINSNLSTLRSKNVICMIIQQNISQLELRFGQAGARSILGNSNCQIILGSNDLTTSTTFSDMFGYKKVLKISNNEVTSQNVSTGMTVQEAVEKVFPPESFGDLQTRKKMVFYFKGKYLLCNRLNCYERYDW